VITTSYTADGQPATVTTLLDANTTSIEKYIAGLSQGIQLITKDPVTGNTYLSGETKYLGENLQIQLAYDKSGRPIDLRSPDGKNVFSFQTNPDTGEPTGITWTAPDGSQQVLATISIAAGTDSSTQGNYTLNWLKGSP
jgi:hypothetical protein